MNKEIYMHIWDQFSDSNVYVPKGTKQLGHYTVKVGAVFKLYYQILFSKLAWGLYLGISTVMLVYQIQFIINIMWVEISYYLKHFIYYVNQASQI